MGALLCARLSMSPEEHRAFWRDVQFTVDKDVVRTDRSNQFFRGEGNPNVESMRYPPWPWGQVPSGEWISSSSSWGGCGSSGFLWSPQRQRIGSYLSQLQSALMAVMSRGSPVLWASAEPVLAPLTGTAAEPPLVSPNGWSSRWRSHAEPQSQGWHL